jgi:Ankyrin repeats (3 copies)
MDNLYMAKTFLIVYSWAVSRILANQITSANKKPGWLGGGESDRMEAIVIFWILHFFSFLEAALYKPSCSSSEENDMVIEESTAWSKKESLKCLEHGQLDVAEKFPKMDMAQSSNSVKDVMMDSIRTGNVEKFKSMIENGLISPDFDRGLFLSEACENGQGSIVDYLLQFIDLLLPYATKCFFVASKKGHHQLVKLLLAVKGVDPTAGNNFAIRYACCGGHTEVVKLLLEAGGVDPTAEKNEAIRFASENGHTKIVKILLTLPGVDPAAEKNEAIRKASCGGHTKVVKLLLTLPGVDPAAEKNEAIRKASYYGHTEVVRLLLESGRVNPAAKKNEAIRFAIYNRHTEVVELLSAVKGVDPAVEDNYAFELAGHNGHAEVVKLLLAVMEEEDVDQPA